MAKQSVCLPTFNGERFVAEAIQSILAQTFEDFELVIVDDCSDDRTREIVGSFADPRMVVYQNDRRLGIPGNWNRCIELARGEYVCVFHQDDLMLPENLARKVPVLDAHPTVGMVHSAVELRTEEPAPPVSDTWLEQSPEDLVSDGRTYFHKLLLRQNCICAPTVVGRRELITRLGGFNEGLGFACDYELWMRMCLEAGVAYLNTPLVVYRWHAQNASHHFRFERGLAEAQSAAQGALKYYREKTGADAEADCLAEALEALGEARRWAVELERAREWLEQQVQNWRGEAAHLGDVIAGLEEQNARCQQATEVRERYLKSLEAHLPFRVLARLGLLPRRSASNHES